MEGVVSLTKKTEGVFAALGLGEGAFSPVARGAFGWTVGTAGVLVLKGMGYASFAFDDNGNTRPFVLFEPDAPNPTYFPWWLPGVFPAIVFGMFV